MSTSPSHEKQLRARRESLIRQTTRSAVGVGTSGFLGTVCQVYYMLPVALASALGLSEAQKELTSVEAEMTHLGLRLRDRDLFIHGFYGVSQKVMLTTATLGHDEAYAFLKNLGVAPSLTSSYNALFARSGLLESVNGVFNTPVDAAKAELGQPQIGDSMTAPQIAAIGGAGVAFEYGTNRAGEVGRQIRTDIERSSEARQRH